jgi:hypothetical protein
MIRRRAHSLSIVAITVFVTLLQAGTIDLRMTQVHPKEAGQYARSPGQTRAVVLIHGLRMETRSVHTSEELQDWQQPDSTLVKTLGADSDVFAISYGQHATLDEIASCKELVGDVAQLRRLGYTDLVLVGHSAGGLIARQFVEDNPKAGVTSVIQVCAPNGGTTLTKYSALLKSEQQDFIDSLSVETRQRYAATRRNRIPDHVQFVCVVGTACGTSDGVVTCDSQWSADLREQGIAAVAVKMKHTQVLADADGTRTVAKLVCEKQTRLQKEHVTQAQKLILGE